MLSYIPQKLNLADRPELNCFPLNTLLSSAKEVDGGILYGFALYEPDFTTYRERVGVKSLTYHNVHNANFTLLYNFSEEDGTYYCRKRHLGKNLGTTYGKSDNWNLFFIHVGVLGLADDEKCELEFVPENGGAK